MSGTERRYAGRTADERRADRRRRLLDAALELFGTEGYTAVGIERLCSSSGVTARHFYEEFGSREGLLSALYDEIVADGANHVAAALAEAGPEQLELARAGLGAFVHSLLDDPRKARIACLEVVGVSPELEAHRRSVLHHYATVTQAQADRLGIARPGATRPFSALSLALVGGTNALLVDWLGDPDALTIDELIDELVYLFVAVARAAAGGEPPPSAKRR